MTGRATTIRRRPSRYREDAVVLVKVTVPDDHPGQRDFKLAVARRLRGARALLDVDQQSLADASGVSRNFVSAMERGAQNLDAYRLSLLAMALGMPLLTLLTGVGLDQWIELAQGGSRRWAAADAAPIEESMRSDSEPVLLR
jgi:transcriptional regulator with XRE-family HTH domain